MATENVFKSRECFLGKNLRPGEPYYIDIAEGRYTIIGGKSGTGKSTIVKNISIQLGMHYKSPLWIFDPMEAEWKEITRPNAGSPNASAITLYSTHKDEYAFNPVEDFSEIDLSTWG